MKPIPTASVSAKLDTISLDTVAASVPHSPPMTPPIASATLLAKSTKFGTQLSVPADVSLDTTSSTDFAVSVTLKHKHIMLRLNAATVSRATRNQTGRVATEFAHLYVLLMKTSSSTVVSVNLVSIWLITSACSVLRVSSTTFTKEFAEFSVVLTRSTITTQTSANVRKDSTSYRVSAQNVLLDSHTRSTP